MGTTLELPGTAAAILQAALEEFAAFGYRRASVEGIARRAGLARATVYLHWRTKDDLFRALVTRLHDEHLAAMAAAAEEPGLELQARLVRVLEARNGRFVQLTSASPNAAELYDRHGRLCGDIAAAAADRSRGLLTGLVQRAADAGEVDLDRSGLSAAEVAEGLELCAHAAKGEDPAVATPASFAAALRLLVRLTLHGLTPG